MFGQDEILSIAESALKFVEADQAEAIISVEQSALTRFAESVIHQNVAESNLHLTVRAVVGKQIGCATSNRVDAEGLRDVAKRAGLLARSSSPNPAFCSLPSPLPITPAEAFSKATAASTPEERAGAVETMVAIAKKARAIASGSLSVASGELAVASSLGIRAYQPWSHAEAVIIVADESDASGYGEWQGKDIADFSPRQAAETAAQKCVASRGEKPIEPGEYTVVLEAPAVADLLSSLSWMGLGATAYQEGRSFLCDQLGKKIAAEGISLYDDGHDPRLFPMAFDYEGIPKQKVMLIEHGVAKAVVYDSYSAGKEGKQSTGHALPPTSTYGPAPLHLCLAPGEATLEEMISSTERGLLVTRFHYTNSVSPRETILTGMTRDGTFLIENGKISRPVQKLRFTESILKTFQRTTMLSREVKLSMGCLVPALKASAFTFTS
jgi:predicted Zn-dependent protease